jgi:uncharacterized protein YegL
LSTLPSLEDAVEFAENPEPRCPCVLLLDCSGSMDGAPIAALGEGLKIFRDQLAADTLASRRVEVAVVTFNSTVAVARDFVTADSFVVPELAATGLTHMGEGIQVALDLVEARKATYRSNGIAYYRPWIFLITDGEPQGEPTDVVDAAAKRIQDAEAAKKVAFFGVGVEQANVQRLGELLVRQPLKLNGLNFVELFVWLSASMQAVSQSRVDDQVTLPPPGWATV